MILCCGLWISQLIRTMVKIRLLMWSTSQALILSPESESEDLCSRRLRRSLINVKIWTRSWPWCLSQFLPFWMLGSAICTSGIRKTLAVYPRWHCRAATSLPWFHWWRRRAFCVRQSFAFLPIYRWNHNCACLWPQWKQCTVHRRCCYAVEELSGSWSEFHRCKENDSNSKAQFPWNSHRSDMQTYRLLTILTFSQYSSFHRNSPQTRAPWPGIESMILSERENLWYG